MFAYYFNKRQLTYQIQQYWSKLWKNKKIDKKS